ncbi:phage protein Gp36 family protein [Riemerella anatipestifer]|uniref:phage protein Gp36 family protein n=1 Tax=Riemerella anatipestifer TaxID=34085 RepID=UPI003DA7D949
MSYLTEQDYKPQIRNWILNVVTQNDPGAREQAELAAQVEMESYLRSRYKVREIFNKQGTERNYLLVMYLVDMAIYHLHSNISPDNIPEIRYVRYKSAIDWLHKVATEKLSPDLPEIDGGEDENGKSNSTGFEYGGNEKYSERY